MREMKDSGIEWIKTIPADWSVRRGKSILTLMKRSPEQYGADEVITCFRDGEVTLRRNRREEGFTFSDKEIGYQGINEGDLVIHGMDGFAGAIGISDSNGKASPVLVVCDSTQNKRFLMYYLRMLATQNVFVALATGIRERSCDLRWNKVADLLFPIPTIEEQYKIVNYLDYKCAKIDSIIEKQQAIIEKLKEYKLLVITEAVTKGLNPDVELKDSGNKWLGCIPKHWKVSKLKYLFGTGDDSLKIGPFGSAMKGKTLESGPYKIYNQAHLIQNDFNLNRHFVSEETFEELSSYEVKPDDILFSMMGTIGKCQIMPSGYPKGIMDSHLLKARLNEKVLPQFFVYAYDKDYSSQVIQQLLYVSNGTIMNGLNSSILKNVIIALPPVNEQQEITKYLDKFIQEVDMRIAKVTKIVDKLQEYKKSLIYEVVTGKKEV